MKRVGLGQLKRVSSYQCECLGVQGITAMMQATCGVFHMQVTGCSGDTVHLVQPALSLPPQRFDALDVRLTPGTFMRPVMHPAGLVTPTVDPSVIPTPAVRMNRGVRRDTPPNHRLQRGVGAIGNDLRRDRPRALQPPPNDGFPVRPASPFPPDATRSKLRVVNCNRALQRGLLVARSGHSPTDCEVHPIHRSHRHTCPLRPVSCGTVHRKKADPLPEFRLAHSRAMIGFVVTIHLSQ